MEPVEDARDLAAYIDAICDTVRCERMPGGAYRCRIPVLANWEATGGETYRCRDNIQAQVISWIARRVARGEPLPAFMGLQPRVVDASAAEVFTERLRLVPYSARRIAAAACDHTALAAILGVQVHHDWPYLATFVDAAQDVPGDDVASVDQADGAAEASLFDWLPVLWTLLDPATALWKWMVIHRGDNMLIGEIGTSNPPRDEPGEDSIQMSYSLVPGYQQCGYMTEAARAYLMWAFTRPHLTWIYAMTECENLASRRVLEKIGARPFESQRSTAGWIDWEILPERLT